MKSYVGLRFLLLVGTSYLNDDYGNFIKNVERNRHHDPAYYVGRRYEGSNEQNYDDSMPSVFPEKLRTQDPYPGQKI